MRKTLYLKFVLGYLIFGFFGFLVVATFVSSMTLEHLKREKADSLYKEATLIANTYASDLYSSNVSLEEVKKQLDALSTYPVSYTHLDVYKRQGISLFRFYDFCTHRIAQNRVLDKQRITIA